MSVNMEVGKKMKMSLCYSSWTTLVLGKQGSVVVAFWWLFLPEDLSQLIFHIASTQREHQLPDFFETQAWPHSLSGVDARQGLGVAQ